MFIVQAHWFMDTYIARFSLIIYYHSLFYSLGMVLLLWRHCPIMISDTMAAPNWHFYQTIVQYDVTIVHYDVTIVALWQTILENIDWSIWYFESVCTITKCHVTRNQPISFEYLHLTYNKLVYLYSPVNVKTKVRCWPGDGFIFEEAM